MIMSIDCIVNSKTCTTNQGWACRYGDSGPMYVPEISLFCPHFDNICPQNHVFSNAFKSGLFYTASVDLYFFGISLP